MSKRILFSCDVEEHFHVTALEAHFPQARRAEQPSRVEANTRKILNIAARHHRSGTFFVLGEVAERHPQLIRDIHAAGHEVASHGYDHTRAGLQTPEAFFADITRSKAVLEQIIGAPVVGYRAPSFGIGPHTPWAHALIDRAGYRYSSSVYPGRHDLYGDATAPRTPYRPLPERPLVEHPITQLRRFKTPAGGGFFRLLPYRVFTGGLPADATFYCHPWEVDPEQPRVTGLPLRARFRHYVNLHRTAGRLDRLLREHESIPMRELYAD